MTEEITDKDIQAEAERLREEVRILESEKRRIFAAFCCADSTLRIRYEDDLRLDGDKAEAERLRAYVTGDKVTP